MEKLVFPRHIGELKYIIPAIQVYAENGSWVSNSDYIEKEFAILKANGVESVMKNDKTDYTKDAELPRYFGFIERQIPGDPKSDCRITDLGKKFYKAYKNGDSNNILETLMLAFEQCTFGKNNEGCPSSDCHLEAPNILLIASYILDGVSRQEFAGILYEMLNNNAPIVNALTIVKVCRDTGKKIANTVSADNKIVPFLISLNFLEDKNGYIHLSSSVKSKYAERITRLPTTNDLVNIFPKLEEPNSADAKKLNSIQKIIFGAPGTGKSHQLEEDCKNIFCDSATSIEAHFIDELKNKPEDEKNESVWLRHIGIKYAKFIYNLSKENSNELLQERWSIEQKFLIKLKNTAKAIVDYGHIISNSVEEIGKRYERVTFHPNYSYAQFVGTYKPVQNPEKGKESEILYKYVPGPFTRILVKALQHPEQDFLLVIEEINRANVAAVFGDAFQLLDRKNGVSEYPIAASEDIKKYLKDDCDIGDCEELRIPNNMYIWATMNSADQGVFPMDTAFKRRWEFEYIDINNNESEIDSFYLPTSMDEKENKCIFENWNSLRKKLNEKLQLIGVNEDKLLGPFFINKDTLEEISSLVKPRKDEKNEEYISVDFQITTDDAGSQNKKKIETFQKSFESKVLMYLYEDMRMYRPDIFQIKVDGKDIDKPRLSQIFKAFERDGIEIFNFSTDRS